MKFYNIAKYNVALSEIESFPCVIGGKLCENFIVDKVSGNRGLYTVKNSTHPERVIKGFDQVHKFIRNRN